MAKKVFSTFQRKSSKSPIACPMRYAYVRGFENTLSLGTRLNEFHHALQCVEQLSTPNLSSGVFKVKTSRNASVKGSEITGPNRWQFYGSQKKSL